MSVSYFELVTQAAQAGSARVLGQLSENLIIVVEQLKRDKAALEADNARLRHELLLLGERVDPRRI
jgi:hypothetical protein